MQTKKVQEGNSLILESPFNKGMIKVVTDVKNIDFSTNISALILIMDEIINYSTKDEFISVLDVSYVRAYQAHSCSLVLEFKDSRFLPIEIYNLEHSRCMAIFNTIVDFIKWGNKNKKWNK